MIMKDEARPLGLQIYSQKTKITSTTDLPYHRQFLSKVNAG